MRLGLIAEQVLAPVPGGTGRYAAEIAAALAGTAAPDDAVDLWTAWHRRAPDPLVAGCGPARRLPVPRRALVAAWERGWPPAVRAAVVHAPTLLAPPRRDRPLVVTVHDTVPWSHPETLTARGVAWHRRMAERVARDADVLVTDTAYVAGEVERLLRPAGRIEVVGLGASLRPPTPEVAAAVARSLELPVDGYLVTLSTVEPRKALDVLLDACALLDGTAVPPLLVVGQPGWGGVDPGREAARRGLGPDRVRVLGRLPDEALGVVVAGATALVMPSREEGFGLPVLEAMALGTPVVSSAAPALVEVGGGATVTVPVGDAPALAEALVAVVRDGALREELRAAGLRRASAYGWDVAARHLWGVFRSLV